MRKLGLFSACMLFALTANARTSVESVASGLGVGRLGASVAVNRAPSIGTHPSKTAQTQKKDTPFPKLSINATGSARLNYQWYSNTVNSNEGGTKVGTNSSSYTPEALRYGILYYYCVVSNEYGSVTSHVSGMHAVSPQGCNFATTSRNLVEITSAWFTTANTWTVGSQVWSDAVSASACQKTTYDGGSSRHHNVDCRSNPSYPGDLFSWCAMMRYADILCPAPWRVPTKDDFVNLDRTLRGAGNYGQNNSILLNKYINVWGGVYGGFAVANRLNAQGTSAYYWSQIGHNADFGYYLFLRSTGNTNVQNFNSKRLGYALRCVR